MDIIVRLLWSVESILFLWGIVQMRFHPKWHRIAFGIIVVIISKVFCVYCPNTFIGMVVGTLIGNTIGILTMFDTTVKSKFVKYWFAFFYVEFVYLPIELCSSAIQIEKYIDKNIVDIIESIFVLCIIFLVALYLKRKTILAEWIGEIPGVYFAIACICAISVSGISSYSDRIMINVSVRVRLLFESLQFVLSILIYMLGIGFAFADFLRKQYKNENIIKDQYLRLSKEHYEAMAMHMQEVRKLKHDMQAHINVLSLYAADSKWKPLKDYLSDLTERHVIQNHKIVSTNNELVDAIISDVAGKNVDNNIIIECEGKFPKDIMVPDFDLCTMFSNLLSNAVEACNKLVNSEKKIHIMIKSTNDELRIAFKNPIEWEVDVEQLGSYTSKKDKTNHGFGVGNIRDTVEKYDGNMVMSAENGIFETVIVFYK